jgi:hypothetical protein
MHDPAAASLTLLLHLLLLTHAVWNLPSGRMMSLPSRDLDAALLPYSCKGVQMALRCALRSLQGYVHSAG